jgi:hypothetical protein
MIETHCHRICRNALILASVVSLLTIAGCGGGGGSQAQPVAVGSPTSSPASTDTATTTPSTGAAATYKFVDDSFASQEEPAKAEWSTTETEVVEAKNFGSGAFTEDTLRAAIETI